MRFPVRRSPLALTGALLLALASSNPLSAAPAEVETAGAAATGAAVIAEERQAVQVIEDCRGRSAEVSDSFDPMQRCPQLIAAVRALGLDQQLQRDWRQHLDHSALEALLALVQRYRAPPPSTAPDLARLPQALRSLGTPAAEQLSWWQRFKRWLDRLLSPQARDDSGWPAQLLSRLSIPRAVQQVLLYLSIAALLAMAVWIIWRELEAAGALSRKIRRRQRAGRSDSPAAPRPAELAFEDLQQAPAGERCVWLVRLLVQALRRSGRLGRESTLTYRELVARPVFDDLQQRACFERLALLAERQRYGSLSLDDAQWLQLLDEGRSLYGHWLPSAAIAHSRGGAASAAA